MQIDGTENLQANNYKMLMSTVNTLKYSQGFYSRLARDIEGLEGQDKQDFIDYINSLPTFKDSVDVVLFLEQ